MNYKSKEDNSYTQAQRQKSRFQFHVPFAISVFMLLMIGCATSPPLENQADVPMRESVQAQHANPEGSNVEASQSTDFQNPLSAGDEHVFAPAFPTFNNTGSEVCTNDEGLPLIYMFSSSLCSHCKWGGGAYDFIVRFLAAEGQIEAHHYDLLSGDDLLTEETENEIPADKLELYRHGNPKDLVPYYNFGCMYDRVGNGYEKENDLVAEGEEMRRVIEALVKMTSGNE